MARSPCAATTQSTAEITPRAPELRRNSPEGEIRHAYAYIGRVVFMVPPVSQVMPRMRKDDTRTALRIVAPMLDRKLPGICKAQSQELTE